MTLLTSSGSISSPRSKISPPPSSVNTTPLLLPKTNTPSKASSLKKRATSLEQKSKRALLEEIFQPISSNSPQSFDELETKVTTYLFNGYTYSSLYSRIQQTLSRTEPSNVTFFHCSSILATIDRYKKRAYTNHTPTLLQRICDLFASIIGNWTSLSFFANSVRSNSKLTNRLSSKNSLKQLIDTFPSSEISKKPAFKKAKDWLIAATSNIQFSYESLNLTALKNKPELLPFLYSICSVSDFIPQLKNKQIAHLARHFLNNDQSSQCQDVLTQSNKYNPKSTPGVFTSFLQSLPSSQRQKWSEQFKKINEKASHSALKRLQWLTVITKLTTTTTILERFDQLNNNLPHPKDAHWNLSLVKAQYFNACCIFSNIGCPEKTRIKLSQYEDQFIHANLVRPTNPNEQTFIFAMYPPLRWELVPKKKEIQEETSEKEPHSISLSISADLSGSNNFSASDSSASSPGPSMVDLFWEMTFKQNVTILNLSNPDRVMERSHLYPYWPEKNHPYVNEEADCSIQQQSDEKELDDELLIRKLEMKKKDHDPKTITMLHLHKWPDHGVVTPKRLLELINRMNTLHKNKKDPMLVHCRAGVGRTGTFAVAYTIVNRIRERIKNGVSLARIFHGISKEDGQDVAPNSFTDNRGHCQIDKARESEGEFGVTDCSASPREHEMFGLGDIEKEIDKEIQNFRKQRDLQVVQSREQYQLIRATVALAIQQELKQFKKEKNHVIS